VPSEDITHDIKLAPGWISDLITKRYPMEEWFKLNIDERK